MHVNGITNPFSLLLALTVKNIFIPSHKTPILMTAIGFESSDDSDENEIKNTTKLKPHQITIKTNPTQNIQPTQYSFNNQLISNPNKRRKLSSITKLQSFALENNPRNINIEEVEPSQYEWAEHPKIAIISALGT